MEIHPLVKLLYEEVPEFKSIFGEEYEDLTDIIYGDLGIQIHDKIINGDVESELVRKGFAFFNKLSVKNESRIDDLLVISVYEGFFYSKICNDVARSYLNGRGRELYEYWMINGHINSNY